MMNNKLFREMLTYLYENDNGERHVVNHILKEGKYTPGDMANTLGYMVDTAMISGCLYQDFNKHDPKTRKRHTVDSVEIKTRILPAGAKYYNDNFQKQAEKTVHVYAQHSNVNVSNPKGQGPNTVNQKIESGNQSKLQNWAAIATIVGTIIAALVFFKVCNP